MKIELAFDGFGTEAQAFAQWLNAQGHNASVGRSTGSYVDGKSTGTDDEARAALEALWDQYCRG